MNRQDLLQTLIENLQNMYRGMLYKDDAHKEGIPFGQKSALFTIAVHETINIKRLANILHVTSGAATQHVEALVKEGLVERSTDPQDRRNVIIILSAKGELLMKKLRQKRATMMKELFVEVTDQELVAYNDIMKKVNDRIKQLGETKHEQ